MFFNLFRKAKKPKEIGILTIHGAWTLGDKSWQDKFTDYMKISFPEVEVFNFRYGFLPAILCWWMAFSKMVRIHYLARKIYIRALINYINKIKAENPGINLSIVAHSFGGWILEAAFQEEASLSCNKMILLHCPLSCHIEQSSFYLWLKRQRIAKVYAWSSHEDEIIGIIAIPPLGQLGYWGLIRPNHPEDRIKPAFQPYEDILYFNYHENLEHDEPAHDPKNYTKIALQCLD